MENRIARLLLAATALVSVVAGTTLFAQDANRLTALRFRFPGAVYTMSNGAERNAILIFDRLSDGRLVRAGAVATGGTGTGAGLGNQGGVVLTGNEKWLLAVNAGSNSISVLQVRRRGLRLVDVEPSGGVRPISVTEHSRHRLRAPCGQRHHRWLCAWARWAPASVGGIRAAIERCRH